LKLAAPIRAKATVNAQTASIAAKSTNATTVLSKEMSSALVISTCCSERRHGFQRDRIKNLV
jgi:hypothetical protein